MLAIFLDTQYQLAYTLLLEYDNFILYSKVKKICQEKSFISEYMNQNGHSSSEVSRSLLKLLLVQGWVMLRVCHEQYLKGLKRILECLLFHSLGDWWCWAETDLSEPWILSLSSCMLKKRILNRSIEEEVSKRLKGNSNDVRHRNCCCLYSAISFGENSDSFLTIMVMR